MFRFYFPFFIKLFMVLLCVIFKSERIYMRHFEYSRTRDVYVRLKTTGAAIKIARGTMNNQQNKHNSVKNVQRQ